MKKYLIIILFSILATSSFAQNKVTLKAGTIIPLQSVNQVKAADVNEGEMVDFRVVNDITVDNHVVISGSYNWTDNAAERNDENILIVKDWKTANQHTREFLDEWRNY